MEPQRRDGGQPLAHGLPPLRHPGPRAITGHCGRAPLHTAGVQRREQDADWGERCRGVQGMGDRCDVGTPLAPARAGADCDGGVGIPGATSDVVRRISGLMDRGYTGAERLDFWDFWGAASARPSGERSPGRSVAP